LAIERLGSRPVDPQLGRVFDQGLGFEAPGTGGKPKDPNGAKPR
jgi:hypothetical protein